MDEKIIVSIIYGLTFLSMVYLQIIIPKISRKNIFLGIKIPESKREDENLKDIYKRYKKINILLGIPMSIVLVMITYFYASSLAFITIVPFVFILLQFIIYLKYNNEVKDLKKKENWVELADNKKIVDTKYISNKDEIQSIFRWAFFPFLIVILNIIVGIYMYPSLPEKIVNHWNFQGVADGFANKSITSVFALDMVLLFLIVTFYYSYYSMMKSKHEIDNDNPELSIEKNKIFKNSWSSYFKWSTIAMVLLISMLNLATLGLFNNMKLFTIITFVLVVLVAGFSIYLSLKMGQGGQKIKLNNEEIISNRYNFEDDDLWKLGNTIYYNPDDPAVFIEKRIGVGWTVNAARPLGMLFYIIMILTIVGTIILGLKVG